MGIGASIPPAVVAATTDGVSSSDWAPIIAPTITAIGGAIGTVIVAYAYLRPKLAGMQKALDGNLSLWATQAKTSSDTAAVLAGDAHKAGEDAVAAATEHASVESASAQRIADLQSGTAPVAAQLTAADIRAIFQEELLKATHQEAHLG